MTYCTPAFNRALGLMRVVAGSRTGRDIRLPTYLSEHKCALPSRPPVEPDGAYNRDMTAGHAVLEEFRRLGHPTTVAVNRSAYKLDENECLFAHCISPEMRESTGADWACAHCP